MVTALAALLVLTAPPRLAELEWTTVKVDKDLAGFFAAEFARALRQQGLGVVTTSEMATVLGVERQRELLGCTDAAASSCLAELGNALGCDGIVVASVARLGDSLRGNLKVLSTRDGRTLAETVVEADTEKDFVRALEAGAARLAAPLRGGAPAVAPPGLVGPAPSLRSRAWLPLVAGGALAVAGGVLVGLAYRNSALLDAQLKADLSVQQASLDLARDGKALQTAGWLGVGLGAAGLATAALLAWLGAEPPVQLQVVLGPQGAGLALSGRWP